MHISIRHAHLCELLTLWVHWPRGVGRLDFLVPCLSNLIHAARTRDATDQCALNPGRGSSLPGMDSPISKESSMTMPSAKLACTASAQRFEEWKRRPVYMAHCFTANLARQLCGVQLKPGEGMASVMGIPEAMGLSTFRALAPFRSAEANELRSSVAALARRMRRERLVVA